MAKLWHGCQRQHPVITRRNELPTEWFCSGKTYSSKALMSGNVKNSQVASVKVQYLDKQKKLVMNIEYN